MSNPITAQISFFPIESNDYKADVNRAIEIIRSYPLEYEIGILSTTVRGDRDEIFKMITTLFNTMDGICKFTLSFTLSNLCGCE